MTARSIQATNDALRQLGERWASGEIDADAYLAQMYRLISAAEGVEADDDPASEQQTHPGLPAVGQRKNAPRWLWALPVLFSLMFLFGLAWWLF